MALKIGDTAPDFTADTTEGRIKFHDWIGDSWAVLFSHPKDFTAVCTTELGYMAKLKPEFDKRGTKIIGLSVDPVTDHSRWADDIKETQGYAPNYPLIGDADLNVAKLYEMLPAWVAMVTWEIVVIWIYSERATHSTRISGNCSAANLEENEF